MEVNANMHHPVKCWTKALEIAFGDELANFDDILKDSLAELKYKPFTYDPYSPFHRFWQFYFSRGLQRLYTGTCIILQKTFNGFLCLLIVFLKSKTHQLNVEDVIKLNKNLW